MNLDSGESVLVPKKIPKMIKKKGRGPGRPSKYCQIDLDQVRRLAEVGLTDKQISHVLGIAEETLNQWKRKPEFSESLKGGKAVADERVERSLFERATGYSHPEEKIFCDKSGKATHIPTIRHYPPDVTACIFWLKNRKPKEWRDKQDLEHSGKVGVEHSVIDEILETLRAALPGDDQRAPIDGELVSDRRHFASRN